MAAKKKTAIARVDKTPITAPSVRVFRDWTPSKISEAERSAEQGNLMSAVAVCEWLLTDDRVTGALDARIDALIGLDPSFEPGKGRRAKIAAKALELGEDWWEAYPESELRQILRWGILLGVAPARHEWVERDDHGGRMMPMPRLWHPQTLRWDWSTRRWTVRESNSVELEVVPGDGEWILHAPFGSQRPWADGLWRSLGRWALLKQFAQADCARHSEKSATKVVTAPEDSEKEQRREVAQALRESGADAVVALAAGFDMKVVEVAANMRDLYLAPIEMADKAISIRIRGGNLTTEVQGGSKAATETQAKTGDGAKLKFDASTLATTIHDQSLTWWAEFNFGDRRLAPWPVWPVEPEEDKSQRATMVKTLGDGLTVWDKLGFDIDPTAVKEEFGLTFLKDRIRERAPDPAPAPPGQDPAPAPSKEAKQPKDPKQPKAMLASGVKAPSGFIDGQMYIDDVVDDSRAKAGAVLEGTLLAGLLTAIDGADSYEDIRAAVLKAYGSAKSPHDVRELIQKALVLADLAGTASVRQDA